MGTTEGIRSNPISLSQSLLLPQHKTTQRTDLSLRSRCHLSIERVCLGTKMADSNGCQGRSHVGDNQELSLRGGHITQSKAQFCVSGQIA